MNQAEIDKKLEEISHMSQMGCCRAQRFAPIGDPMFCEPKLYEVFAAQMKEVGGMTPQVSKAIGW